MKTALLFMKTPYPEQRTVTPWPYMVVEDTNLAMESTPPPFVIATPKYGINTVPTPTVAITKAWLAHDTYNYRHGMSAPPAPGMGTAIG